VPENTGAFNASRNSCLNTSQFHCTVERFNYLLASIGGLYVRVLYVYVSAQKLKNYRPEIDVTW